jgi:hypothetical protein
MMYEINTEEPSLRVTATVTIQVHNFCAYSVYSITNELTPWSQSSSPQAKGSSKHFMEPSDWFITVLIRACQLASTLT